MKKGVFENKLPQIQILLVVAIMVISLIVITILGFLILIPIYGADQVMSSLTFADTGILRSLQIIQSFAMFVAPAVIAGYFFSKKPARFLGFEKPIISLFFLALITFFVCQPMISFLTQLNESMVFPNFLKSLEDILRTAEIRTNELIFNLLDTKQPSIISVNIFMIVILPAFGEELFFRGTLQPMFGRLFKSSHAAVWVTAFIFAFIHLQFLSFLPRFILGALLGYLFVYGKNIWYPIAGHFLNNLITIILFYYYRYTQPDINPFDSTDEFGTLMIIGSFISVGLLIFLFVKISRRQSQQDLLNIS